MSAEEHLDAANAGGMVGGPRQFRKKPVVIEAVRWSGSNWHEVLAFAGHDAVSTNGLLLFVKTMEGELSDPIPSGHWIIKGVVGEIYPCAPAVFDETYEPVQVGAR